MRRMLASLVILALLPGPGSAQGGIPLTPPAKPPRVQPPLGPLPPATDLHGDWLPDGAVTRLGTARWRLHDATRALGFTPDGKALVVASGGSRGWSLHPLEVPTGKSGPPLVGAHYSYAEMGFAAAGKVLAIADGDRLDLWELPAGRLLRQIKIHPNEHALALAPDGKTVATAGNSLGMDRAHPVRLWDVDSGRLLASLEGHRTAVRTLTFSADGKRLLSGSPVLRYGVAGGGTQVIPGAVIVWDVAARKPLVQHANQSYSVALAPDGRTWAYLGGDNRVRLVATDDGKERARIPMPGSAVFAFSADGKLLATTGFGSEIRLWDSATGREVRTLEGRLGRGYPTLHFSPDGKTLACSARHHWSRAVAGIAVRLWDVASGKEIRPFPSHQDEVACIAQSPDGKTAASGSKDGSLFLWQAASGKALHRLADHKAGVSTLAFSADGRLLAAGGQEGTVRLWHVAAGWRAWESEGADGAVLALTFSADGKVVWACGAKGRARGWDVDSGKLVGQFDGPAGAVGEDGKPVPVPLHAAVFSPDGGLLAHVEGGRGQFAGAPRVRVCRVPSGKELVALDLKAQQPKREENNFEALHCWAVAFSADGRLLATSESIETRGLRLILGSHTVRLWEVATGKQVLEVVDLSVPVLRLALSPDGRVLAHGHGQSVGFGQGIEHMVFLRDVSAGRTLHQVVSDKGELMCMQSGEQLRGLAGHAGGVSCVAFAPDGRTVLTGGMDGGVVAWSVAAFAPKRAAAAPAKELGAVWDRLGSGDASLGYQAIRTLTATPEQAVRLLKERLKPAPAADAKRVAQRIGELEDRSFVVRQKAFDELATYAEQIEAALRKALPGQRSLEGQRRVQQLLDRLDRELSPGRLRELRALAALERIGTVEARRLLEVIAAGAPTRVTHEAQASLRRLQGSTGKGK